MVDNIDETASFITRELNKELNLVKPGFKADDRTDFFAIGLDSSSIPPFISRIRDSVKKTIRAQDLYQYPTAVLLATYILKPETLKDPEITNIQMMEKLVKEYSSFSNHVPVAENPKEGEYILVTGATGSLGAHIVAELVASDRVKKVYCLVRQKGTSLQLKDRIIAAFEAYGIDETDPGGKVEVYSSDFRHDTLRLATDTFQMLLDNVTAVIHAAWAVNYNMNLASFVHLIHGSKTLMDFCLCSKRATPASFIFISSVAVNPSDTILPEHHLAQPPEEDAMGYSQSKYVVEQLCRRAPPAMTARVLRLGQIVGSTTRGHWNASEVVPVIASFANSRKTIPAPAKDEQVFWLPVDVAALVCCRLAFQAKPEEGDDVYNVANPRSISWNLLFLPALAAAGLEFTPELPSVWFSRFVEWGHGLEPFIRNIYLVDELTPAPAIATERAMAECPEMGLSLVNEAMVKLFVQFWKTQENWMKYVPMAENIVG